MFWMLVRTMLALALVLALGWAVLRGMQRRGKTQAPHNLERLGSLTLTPKRQIQLVRIGRQVWALGYHEQGMTVIGTVPPEDLATPASPVNPSPGVSFPDLFNVISSWRRTRQPGADHD